MRLPFQMKGGRSKCCLISENYLIQYLSRSAYQTGSFCFDMEYRFDFNVEDVDFSLEHSTEIAQWLTELIEESGHSLQMITYVFCSDAYLLALNQEHLEHDYFTDILTFPLHHQGAPILSDIFISIDRVRDNALSLGHDFLEELHRVMAHGVLHLLGHDDHGEENQQAMRLLEDQALGRRTFV